MSRFLVCVVAVACASCAVLPARAADTRIAGAAAHVTAYGGEVVWSAGLAHGYRLYHRTAGGVERLPVRASSDDIHPDLGPTAKGGVRAIYRRCVKRSCGIYEFDFRAHKELRAPKLVVPRRCTVLAPSFFK